jgi:hypothetical protein
MSGWRALTPGMARACCTGTGLLADADVPGFFKVWGASSDDVWVVGDGGVVLRGNARDGFAAVPTGSCSRPFVAICRARPCTRANLFHLSVALWDAWAAYDELATGYVSTERQGARDVDAARREAISHAAYRVLRERMASATGGAVSFACFAAR